MGTSPAAPPATGTTASTVAIMGVVGWWSPPFFDSGFWAAVFLKF
jgi:hypothetical protein